MLQSAIQKYKKSVICHSTITDFILIYNLIPLLCLGFGIPIASLNSSLLRLNQLTCETPSIVKSNLPFSPSLMEQTERLASKLWLTLLISFIEGCFLLSVWLSTTNTRKIILFLGFLLKLF